MVKLHSVYFATKCVFTIKWSQKSAIKLFFDKMMRHIEHFHRNYT